MIIELVEDRWFLARLETFFSTTGHALEFHYLRNEITKVFFKKEKQQNDYEHTNYQDYQTHYQNHKPSIRLYQATKQPARNKLKTTKPSEATETNQITSQDNQLKQQAKGHQEQTFRT